MQLIFEKSKPGRRGLRFPRSDVPEHKEIAKRYARTGKIDLPEVSELDVVRHFTKLSQLNFSVDTQFYPLGSCTMKYNPKFTEVIAGMDGFQGLHPLLPQLVQGGMLTQGALEIIFNLESLLCTITGMSAFTCQPMAGAHGELTGIMLIAAYHRKRGKRRKHVLVPDSSHGTNPASAAIAGYDVITIPTDKNGVMDVEEFRRQCSDDVAAVMLTCPNTLGLFHPEIDRIAQIAHEKDVLLYYDGANLNAMLGKARPGDLGFDVVHVNLHKTFSTPHGGGGPGAGPVGVNEKLEPFLPISRVIRRKDGTFFLDYDKPDSIGYIASFYGNFGILLRAYSYILLMGREGLASVSEHAVLNANYLRVKLREFYDVAYDRVCMHECVLSASRQMQNGIRALDIAKALIDMDIHAPTVYFPLTIKEALMIEPTETESKETLDNFVKAMKKIAEQAENDPEVLKKAPATTPVQRLDETKATRNLDLRWNPPSDIE